jgi:hypothetical protein
MKMFKRSPPPRLTDEYLTYFTAAQARDFRRIVGNSFAAVGRDVAVHVDHVEDRSGTTFGLWNIGALCAGVDMREWPDLIDDHVRRVTTPTEDVAVLSHDEFAAGLHLRIADVAALPNLDLLGYAREVAPGLLEVLSVDLPDSVATPAGDELLAHGSIEDLVVIGRSNLRALLDSDTVSAETADKAGGGFTTVTGDSFFTASLALLTSETMERFTADDDFGRGALVAVPFRHQLLYRVVDGPDAGYALDRMFSIARHSFFEEPGPLSPHVYWVRNNRWIQVTSLEGGKPRVHVHGKLAEAFDTYE